MIIRYSARNCRYSMRRGMAKAPIMGPDRVATPPRRNLSDGG